MGQLAEDDAMVGGDEFFCSRENLSPFLCSSTLPLDNYRFLYFAYANGSIVQTVSAGKCSFGCRQRSRTSAYQPLRDIHAHA